MGHFLSFSLRPPRAPFNLAECRQNKNKRKTETGSIESKKEHKYLSLVERSLPLYKNDYF